MSIQDNYCNEFKLYFKRFFFIIFNISQFNLFECRNLIKDLYLPFMQTIKKNQRRLLLNHNHNFVERSKNLMM